MRKLGICGAAAVVLTLAVAPAARADYVGALSGSNATMTGDAEGNVLSLSIASGLVRHNRASSGDPGFASDFDFNSAASGVQTLVAGPDAAVAVAAGGGSDTLGADFGAADPATQFIVTQERVYQPFGGGQLEVGYDSSAESLAVSTTGQDDDVQVEGSAAGTSVRVITRAGGDTIEPGGSCCASATLDRLGGPVNVQAGVGHDLLFVYDSSETENHHYRAFAARVVRDGAPNIGFSDVEDARVLAGTGHDLIEILGPVTGVGDQGNDRIELGFAGSGFDQIGSAGNDVIALADGASARSLTGNAGTDRLDYSAYTTPLAADLTAGTATGASSSASGFESITGGAARDSLIGGAAFGIINGGAAQDQLRSGAFGNRLIGGPGADGFRGGPAADDLRARDGEIDYVATCGGGADSVLADTADNVDSACETVNRG